MMLARALLPGSVSRGGGPNGRQPCGASCLSPPQGCCCCCCRPAGDCCWPSGFGRGGAHIAVLRCATRFTSALAGGRWAGAVLHTCIFRRPDLHCPPALRSAVWRLRLARRAARRRQEARGGTLPLARGVLLWGPLCPCHPAAHRLAGASVLSGGPASPRQHSTWCGGLSPPTHPGTPGRPALVWRAPSPPSPPVHPPGRTA